MLHVLPHPGGGGETYIDLLGRMQGFRFDKVYIAPGPQVSPGAVVGGIRAQLRSRRCDVLHVHGEVASGLCLPALALQRSVVTMNGLHLIRRLSGRKRSIANANLRLVASAASRTICVAESELVDVQRVVGYSKRLVLIRNGVDAATASLPAERNAVRAELGLEPTEVVGLYLAALDPHKEPLLAARAALQAAADGSPVVLLFAGDGPLLPALRGLAAGSRTLRVLGFQSKPRQLLAAADFFVLPSQREGLSFALLEAMAHGLPVVVSDVPGNRDAVSGAGIVVPAPDVASLAHAFRRLLDSSLRADLGRRARARVVERMSAHQMIQETRAVYEDVLGVRRVDSVT